MDATVRIGFVPLVDCALLAIAKEQGFFKRNQVDVELRKAQSWGQLRDKLLAREYDAAHLLITMPLQFALETKGEDRKYGEPPVAYAFTLSRNGNSIILSNALWNDGVRDGVGLEGWLAFRPGKKLRLGVVHQQGTQEYFLRSWLAGGGLGQSDRFGLHVIPPQEMVGALRKGEIDGFCVGEPWSRRAAASKLGRIVAESRHMLPGLGEKVLGTRTDWHRGHALQHSRIIRALAQAGTWMADPANLVTVVEIISSKHYVNTPKTVVEAAIKEGGDLGLPLRAVTNKDFNSLDPNYPSRSHAQWYLEQMVKFGAQDFPDITQISLSSICLESFYKSAMAGMLRSSSAPVSAAISATA